MIARRLSTLFILTFLLGVPAVAQTTKEEFARLRQHLAVSEEIPITLAESSSLPDDRPLKLYIATGLDMAVHANFTKWIDEWNRKDGKKYGAIEVVSELSQADVILARYTLRDKLTDRTETYSSTVPGTVYDPRSGSTVTRPVPRTYSSSYSVVPVYAYVIGREAGALRILWRYVDQASLEETKHSGKFLRDDFFKMMKARGKSRK